MYVRTGVTLNSPAIVMAGGIKNLIFSFKIQTTSDYINDYNVITGCSTLASHCWMLFDALLQSTLGQFSVCH